jgi:hypothetical protein
MTTSPEWTFNDGWILMSVFLTHGKTGASLAELLGAADAMNHAIPTKGLASCGVLKEEGDRFRIADTHLPLITKVKDEKGGLVELPEKGKKWLTQSAFSPNDSTGIAISEERILSAFELYRKLLRQR